MIILGDYVSATLIGKDDTRQGVIVEIKKGETFVIKGRLNTYVCDGIPVIVPDKNLDSETLEFVEEVRKTIKRSFVT